MNTIDRYLPKALLLISIALLAWGLLGLLEYFLPSFAFGLQNGSFPAGLQFLHFLAIMLTGAIFVLGFMTHWPHTPHVTVTMYAVLATLCFVETIDFGAFGGGTRGIAIMTIEFVVYIVLGTYLLRSSAIGERFGRPSTR